MTITGASAAFSPQTNSRRAAAFVAARRHSRMVRFLRFALPTFTIILGAALITSMVYDPTAAVAPNLDVGKLGLNGSAIVMQKPRLTGFGSERRAYEVSAERADQSLAKPKQISLSELSARMEFRDDGWARMFARIGHLDGETEVLDLKDAIRIDTDFGDRASLSEAKISFAAGEILSNAPVEIALGLNNLKADRMHVTENGQRAVFEGRVVMVLHPAEEKNSSNATPAEASGAKQ